MEMPGYAPPWWLSGASRPSRLDPHTLAGETDARGAGDRVDPGGPRRRRARAPAPRPRRPRVRPARRHHDLQRRPRGVGGRCRRTASPSPTPSSATRGTPGRRSTCAPSRPPASTGSRSGMPCAVPSSSPAPASAASRPSCSGCSRRRGSVGSSRSRGRSSRCATTTRRAATATSAGSPGSCRSVLDMRHAEHPLVVGMTCGALEENVANNRDMAVGPAAGGARRHAARGRRTCTTTPRGATPSTRHSPTCCAGSGTTGPERAGRAAGRGCGGGSRPAGWGRMETSSRAAAGAGARRDARGRAARDVGTPGAAVPLRGRVAARDAEHNGMLDAVRWLVDAGRISLFCVD